MSPRDTKPSKLSVIKILSVLVTSISKTPRYLANFTIALVDFLIQLLPRLVRGSLLSIAVGAALTLTFGAFRAMWWLVCWINTRF